MQVLQRLSFIAVMVAVFGCDGTLGEGTDGVETTLAASVLVNQSPVEQESPNCPGGGVALDYGVDANADGVLSPAEVSKVLFICHGRAGRDVDPALVTELNDKMAALETELTELRAERITPGERGAIAANSTKVGITLVEKQQIEENEAKGEEAHARLDTHRDWQDTHKPKIDENSAKVGISTEEKGAIVATAEDVVRAFDKLDVVEAWQDEKVVDIEENTDKVGVSDKNLRDLALIKFNAFGVKDQDDEVYFKYSDPNDETVKLVERADDGEVVAVKDGKAFPISEWQPVPHYEPVTGSGGEFPNHEWYTHEGTSNPDWNDTVAGLGNTKTEAVNTLVYNTLTTITPDGETIVRYTDPETKRTTLEMEGGATFTTPERLVLEPSGSDVAITFVEKGGDAREFTLKEITGGHELPPTAAEQSVKAYKDIRSVKVGDETLVSFVGSDGGEYYFTTPHLLTPQMGPACFTESEGVMKRVGDGEVLGEVTAGGLIGVHGLITPNGIEVGEGKRASFDSVLETMASFEASIIDLGAETAIMGATVGGLTGSVNILNSKATILETDIGSLSTSIETLDTKVETSFESLESSGDFTDFTYNTGGLNLNITGR